ncbi:MAG: CDP-alcohol phosphatidyltransferase family protein [candidate division WOR-3 bacterium]
MKESVKNWGRNFLSPLTNLLIKLKITADCLTIASLPTSMLAGIFIAYRKWLLAIIFIIIIALFDTLDGEIARKTGTIHKKGAFLDSVLDRIAEFFIFLGFFLYYYPNKLLSSLVFCTIFTSMLVSYIRARAEGIGQDCKIGIFERPIRFIVIILGLIILRYPYFHYALLVILIGNIITIFQRVFYVLR